MPASTTGFLWLLCLSGALSCTPTPVARDAPAPPSSSPAPTSPASAAPPAASAAAEPSIDPSSSGLANPASVHCQKNGGKLEIVTEPAGEIGVCVFADGSRCREWDFYRGRCSAGSCQEKTGKCSP